MLSTRNVIDRLFVVKKQRVVVSRDVRMSRIEADSYPSMRVYPSTVTWITMRPAMPACVLFASARVDSTKGIKPEGAKEFRFKPLVFQRL
jgi:hypothetical protein